MTVPPDAITAALKVAPDGLFTAEIQQMLEAAAPWLRAEGAAAERAAVIKLARDCNVTCNFTEHAPDGSYVLHRSRAFADLLEEIP